MMVKRKKERKQKQKKKQNNNNITKKDVWCHKKTEIKLFYYTYKAQYKGILHVQIDTAFNNTTVNCT